MNPGGGETSCAGTLPAVTSTEPRKTTTSKTTANFDCMANASCDPRHSRRLFRFELRSLRRFGSRRERRYRIPSELSPQFVAQLPGHLVARRELQRLIELIDRLLRKAEIGIMKPGQESQRGIIGFLL